MDDNADIHLNDLSPQYYDFVGDIQWVSSKFSFSVHMVFLSFAVDNSPQRTIGRRRA